VPNTFSGCEPAIYLVAFSTAFFSQPTAAITPTGKDPPGRTVNNVIVSEKQ